MRDARESGSEGTCSKIERIQSLCEIERSLPVFSFFLLPAVVHLRVLCHPERSGEPSAEEVEMRILNSPLSLLHFTSLHFTSNRLWA